MQCYIDYRVSKVTQWLSSFREHYVSLLSHWFTIYSSFVVFKFVQILLKCVCIRIYVEYYRAKGVWIINTDLASSETLKLSIYIQYRHIELYVITCHKQIVQINERKLVNPTRRRYGCTLVYGIIYIQL